MPKVIRKNFSEQFASEMDWDCRIYLLRKIKGQLVPTLVGKFTLFSVTPKQIVDISRKFNMTKYYIFESKKIVYEDQLLSRH